MTLNGGSTPVYQISFPSGACCVKLMLIAHAVGSKKDIPGSVDFSDVQIMHKLAG